MKPIQTVPTDKNKGLLFYLALLTVFFVLIECSFFIQCNKDYFFVTTVILHSISIPLTILPEILLFFFIQFIIHALFCLLTWLISILTADFLAIPSSKRYLWAIGVWGLSLLTVFVANQYYFPNAKFTELTLIFLPNQAIAKVAFTLMMVLMSWCITLALLELIKRGIKQRWLLIGFLLLVITFYFTQQPKTLVVAKTSDARPNIFIIGVDSLRPDFLSYFGHQQRTPFFDRFLSEATVFSEAMTPLARTFPSWAGILTGEYPRTLNVRTNLTKQHNLDFSSSLAAILKQDGYETIYATDETRFSNIGTNFGFNQIITPKTGLNDFIIGSFNDFPLSNLLINSRLGQWLFPYSYANRAVFFTYYPNTFISLLAPALKNATKPLFLAAHFCLPHYPYLWADVVGSRLSYLERYQASIARADAQIGAFYTFLKENQLLERAIVILLSDHGEALEIPGDRITEREWYVSDQASPPPVFYPPGVTHEKFNRSAGHGTDVLGFTQYHSLLSFKLYGMGEQQIKTVPGVVSLLAIKPTILSLLGKPTMSTPSNSLLPVLRGNTTLPPEHLFLESDFSPESIRTIYPNLGNVLLEGAGIFAINKKTTRLYVKDNMLKKIINSKQYADIYGEWVLALYPQADNTSMPVLVNLRTGTWTNALDSTFAKQSPAASMLAALQGFYGPEIKKLK